MVEGHGWQHVLLQVGFKCGSFCHGLSLLCAATFSRAAVVLLDTWTAVSPILRSLLLPVVLFVALRMQLAVGGTCEWWDCMRAAGPEGSTSANRPVPVDCVSGECAVVLLFGMRPYP